MFRYVLFLDKLGKHRSKTHYYGNSRLYIFVRSFSFLNISEGFLMLNVQNHSTAFNIDHNRSESFNKNFKKIQKKKFYNKNVKTLNFSIIDYEWFWTFLNDNEWISFKILTVHSLTEFSWVIINQMVTKLNNL